MSTRSLVQRRCPDCGFAVSYSFPTGDTRTEEIAIAEVSRVASDHVEHHEHRVGTMVLSKIDAKF